MARRATAPEPSVLIAASRVALALLLVSLNTVLLCLPLFAVALAKAVLPWALWRRGLSVLLIGIAEAWIRNNGRLIRALTPTRIEVAGTESLRRERSYLVLCNHQSWVDIPVLQDALIGHAPFLRFFLKQQLIWVPFLGLAWWALDFPFMRRFSREQLERRPDLRGTDVAATRRACAKFRDRPVSVMNFVEGTRYTTAKHLAQASPFRHLLKPKSGGVAFVLEAMGDVLHSVVDVTVVYPHGRPTVLDLFSGRLPKVVVDIVERPIPADLLGGDYEGDAEFRARFTAWIQGLWQAKDARIAQSLQA